MVTGKTIFYPIISRRKKYSLRNNGENYHYSHYRQEIREDCQQRCVYCDIQEAECGGDELMELEHFRPQKHYSHLSNDPHNLVYSCSGCNILKSDHWPALGINPEKTITDNGEGFVDPFNSNRNDFFQVLENGEIEAVLPPAKYMILRLVLNRESRKRVREIRIEKLKLVEFLDKRIEELNEFIKTNSFTEKQQTFLNSHFHYLVTFRANLLTCLFWDI